MPRRFLVCLAASVVLALGAEPKSSAPLGRKIDDFTLPDAAGKPWALRASQDAKAIVHHCGEATRYAETLIKRVSVSDPHRDDAMTPLDEVIRQCSRVSDIGIHADPGLLLNPALKARAAALESMKLLGLNRTNKS